MAHAMRTLQEKIVYPSSLECMHAVSKGVSQFTFPSFGSARESRLSVPLTQGQASFEEYLKGYATITSDCRGQPFTAPDDTYVAKAIVRVEGKITVKTSQAKLIKDRTVLVITDKIQFDRSSTTDHVNQPIGNSVTAHIYAQSKNEYEVCRDVTEGIFASTAS